MEPGTGMGLRGRSGILSLVDSCLKEDPAAERPVTMLLGPAGSGASEAHSALMERFGPDYPFAFVNFGGAQSLLPRYALGLLARQLERKLPRYGRSRFPLLSLGLLASDQELRMRSLVEGRRTVQRRLDRFQEENEARYGDYLAAFFEVGMGAVGMPEGASTAALALFQDALRRGRRTGAGLLGGRLGSRLTSGAHWYGRHPMIRSADPMEALVELNLWRHEGDETEQDRLDLVLFSAFLEDLRRNTARNFMPRSYLLLLDNSHTEYGRHFLDLLLRSRHDETVVAGHDSDPLTVVASSNRWLPRWGPATGDSWPWQLRGPDRASLADWNAHRPPRDSEDSWWYPLRLRDLNLDEVRIRIELQLGGNSDLAPLTRLTPSCTGSPEGCRAPSTRCSTYCARPGRPRTRAPSRTTGCAPCPTGRCAPGSIPPPSPTPPSATSCATSTEPSARPSPNAPPPGTSPSPRGCSAPTTPSSATSGPAGC